ncbi:MAG: indolepyruvate oxidoreductase subunit beta [Phycisphaerales bacterium]|nr:indolepyruvate oxidoreductase subunit beta [Phycisphaerales bacterium]
MKRDILLSGVGGQGAISIASATAQLALRNELSIKQSESHGMSQRGGAVVSHIRYADHPVYSDLIEHGAADLIIAVEPMEALRYVDYLAPEGVIVTSVTPVLNIANYPSLDEILDHLRGFAGHIMLDAEHLAKAAGTAKAANMVLLGAASPYMGMPEDQWNALLADIWHSKGDKVIKANQQAFAIGLDAGRLYRGCIEAGVDPSDALVIANHIRPESGVETHVAAWVEAFATNKGRELIESLRSRRGMVSMLPSELEKELEPAR